MRCVTIPTAAKETSYGQTIGKKGILTEISTEGDDLSCPPITACFILFYFCLLFILITAAISISGFSHATGLFVISMLFWFCVTYMFIRDHCGEVIYNSCCLPVISLMKRNWRILRW